MSHDWKRHVSGKSIERELRRLRKAKAQSLSADKVFITKTAKIKNGLEDAFLIRPTVVRSFFRQFSHPKPSHLRSIRQFLRRVAEWQVRKILLRYLRYFAQFGVAMKFRERKPHFKPVVLIPLGPKFHVKVADGHIRPLRPLAPGQEEASFLESDTIKVPHALAKMLDSGFANFVRVDDASGDSALSEIESIAYRSDRITFILHKAELPYVFCLIGDNVSKKRVQDAGKIITAFQRQYLRRTKAGRPRDPKMLQTGIELRGRPGPLKESAALLPGGETERDLKRKQVFLSRIGKMLK